MSCLATRYALRGDFPFAHRQRDKTANRFIKRVRWAPSASAGTYTSMIWDLSPHTFPTSPRAVFTTASPKKGWEQCHHGSHENFAPRHVRPVGKKPGGSGESDKKGAVDWDGAWQQIKREIQGTGSSNPSDWVDRPAQFTSR